MDWRTIYFLLTALVAAVVVWRRHAAAFPALTLIIIQWCVYNLFYDGGFWHALSNQAIDLLILLAMYYFWLHKRGWMYGALTLIFIARVLWHMSQTAFGISDFNYVIWNNRLFAMELGTVLLAAIMHRESRT